MLNMAAMRSTLARIAGGARLTTRCPLAGASAQPLAACAQRSQALSVRDFSSNGINGINGINGMNGLNGINGDHHEDEEDIDSDLSPFERLLQHSKQFRDEVGLEELQEEIESEFLVEETTVEFPEEEAQEETTEENAVEEEKETPENDKLDAREADHADFVGQIRRPRGPRSEQPHKPRRHHEAHHDEQEFAYLRYDSPREVKTRVREEIARASDVDFEHGLRDLDTRRAKNKMYAQLLVAGSDRNMVCQNCGEVGHVARNCMLPTICSSCGDVGHRQSECPHRRYDERQLAAAKRLKTYTEANPVDKKKMAEERRRLEIEAIQERHTRMKEAFDAEIDEYVDRNEAMATKRKERARQAAEEEQS